MLFNFTHILVVSIIFSGNVMSRTMHYITYLFNYVVIDGFDYVWLQTVEILLENVAEILVVLLIYCWLNYCVQLGLWSALTVC